MTLRSLFTASALVTLGMLVGRALGLLREMLIAGSFGVGHEADMAILLLLIPDFITSALVGFSASATLIPAFGARQREHAVSLMWQALVASVTLFTLIAAGIYIHQLHAGSPMLSAGNRWAFLLFLASLPLTAATSIITAWLQYRGRFTVPAFANAIFNGIIILIMWLLPVGLPMLACGICAATFIRLVAHVVAWHRVDSGIAKLTFTPWHLDRELLKSYVATAGTSIFNSVPIYAPYVILAIAGSGVALFNYAFKLILMPAMLGQGMIQMVLLPWLVHLRRGDGEQDMHASHSVALQSIWGFSLALCLALALVSHDVVSLCFGHGRMTQTDVDAVTRLFAIGVWAVPGLLVSTMWQQIMYAHEQPRPPLYASALMAVFIVPTCVLGNMLMGLPGIALMYAVVQAIPVLWLVVMARKSGMIGRLLPPASYAWITLATLAVWFPLAGVYRSLALPAVPGLIVGMFVGAAALTAGCLACAPVRQQLNQRLAHRL